MIQLSSSTETTAQTLFQSFIVGRSRLLSSWTSAPWWPVHQRRATMSRVWPPCPSSAFLPFVILGGWRLGCPSLTFVPSFMLSAFCPPLLSWEYFRLLCYSWRIKTACPFSLASKSFFLFKEVRTWYAESCFPGSKWRLPWPAIWKTGQWRGAPPLDLWPLQPQLGYLANWASSPSQPLSPEFCNSKQNLTPQSCLACIMVDHYPIWGTERQNKSGNKVTLPLCPNFQEWQMVDLKIAMFLE